MANEKKMDRKQLSMRIGANIKFKREQFGLTVGELARALGITEAFVGLIERGERGTCLENLIFLADFFSVPLEDFFMHDLKNMSVAENDNAEHNKEEHNNLKNMVDCLSEDECRFVINVIKEMRKHLY